MLGNVLILGGTGLLGQALITVLRQLQLTPLAPPRNELDVLDFKALEDYLDTRRPSTIFNAVAYSQVEDAEDDEDAAMPLNRDLPAQLAALTQKRGIRLMHYSTDFVFDGKKRVPYLPEDTPNPLSAYGRSKLAGENAVLSINTTTACIVRTAWLFGPGRKNFVRAILGKALEGSPLRVVDDQIGSPTFTEDLAYYSLSLAQAGMPGIFHIVNRGAVSWYTLAKTALELKGLHTPITPVKTEEFPMKAARPEYSALHTKKFTQATGIVPRPWTEALADHLGAEPS